MKYPWLALSISLIWLMGTYSILVSERTSVNGVIMIALISTVILSYFGFKAPK